MQGFDQEFVDLPDYIISITERIWEGRRVDLIRRWYAENCVTHTSMGPVVGTQAVIAATLDTLNAFPDRRLLPEDIIWSGQDDGAGYLSSHRVSAPARHDGDSAFGPPTGRHVHFRAIADCFCRNNMVEEEWLVRDQSGIAVQLGLDPRALATVWAERDAAAGRAAWHVEPARKLRDEGAFRSAALQDHPAAHAVREGWAAIWRGDLARVRSLYHPAAVAHVPGARTLHGHDRIDRWLIGHLSAFPDAQLVIEHSIARDDPGMATRVATRWWLTGTHAGTGSWGAPSGATVLMLGITHSEVVDGLVRQEWTVFDEVAVLKQIALHRG